MNNHAGWSADGRCVLCRSASATGECDPRATIDRLEAENARLREELKDCGNSLTAALTGLRKQASR
jgi:hypothetical protein